MAFAIKYKLLIYFVRKDDDPGIPYNCGKFIPVAFCPDGAGGVVRCVNNDGPGTLCNRSAHKAPVYLEVRCGKGYGHHPCAIHFYIGNVAVVGWFQYNDFIARL